jgi:hypothetical protein
MKNPSKKRLILGLIFLGIGFRLLYGFLFNQMLDYMNILSLAKSVAETKTVTGGLIALQKLNFSTQLYGKIFYQIIALWLIFLEKINLLQIRFIFDTKPFQDIASYMIGLWQWSPPLYQLTAIKLIQFLWDFLFVFFLYKTAQLINKKLAWLAILFWAINPYFMMINYAFFMPDIFMMATFVAGVYFWLKSIKEKKLEVNLTIILSLFFLVLGVIIKQLPLLIVPFFIISFATNKKSFFKLIGVFIIFYFLFKQGWAQDSYFINKFFLFSKESMGILRNNFNSMPYFLIFYSIIFLLLIKNKEKILMQYENIIILTITIISLTYINDPIFFIQFTIWILPFTFLAALISSKYQTIFSLSMLAILLKGWQNEFYLSAMLSPTIGAMYNEFLSNKIFIDKFFSFEIYDLILKFTIFLCYLIIFIECLSFIFYKKSIFSAIFEKLNLNFSIKKIILILFASYIGFNLIDYKIKSSFILLPQKKYQIQTEEINLTKKPINIEIYNPGLKKINALQLIISRKGKLTYDDYLIFDFYQNGKKFLSKKISDFEIPQTTDEKLIVFLPKTIDKKSFSIKIYKEKGINEIVVYKALFLNQLNKPENGLYNGYEIPPNQSLIQVKFDREENIFPLTFRGKYELKDIFYAFRHHTQGKLKKIFFVTYLTLTLFIFIVSLFLLKNHFSKIKTS